MNKALVVAIHTSCNQERQEACFIGYNLCLQYVGKGGYDNPCYIYIYRTFYLLSYCSVCHYLHSIAVTQELSFLLSNACLLQDRKTLDSPEKHIILGFCIHNLFV